MWYMILRLPHAQKVAMLRDDGTRQGTDAAEPGGDTAASRR
jgi:hypothetical protein